MVSVDVRCHVFNYGVDPFIAKTVLPWLSTLPFLARPTLLQAMQPFRVSPPLTCTLPCVNWEARLSQKTHTFRGYMANEDEFKAANQQLIAINNVRNAGQKPIVIDDSDDDSDSDDSDDGSRMFPKDEARQQELAKRLFEAMVNIDDIVDRPQQKKATSRPSQNNANGAAQASSAKRQRRNNGAALPVHPDANLTYNSRVNGLLSKSDIELELMAWQLLVSALFGDARLISRCFIAGRKRLTRLMAVFHPRCPGRRDEYRDLGQGLEILPVRNLHGPLREGRGGCSCMSAPQRFLPTTCTPQLTWHAQISKALCSSLMEVSNFKRVVCDPNGEIKVNAILDSVVSVNTFADSLSLSQRKITNMAGNKKKGALFRAGKAAQESGHYSISDDHDVVRSRNGDLIAQNPEDPARLKEMTSKIRKRKRQSSSQSTDNDEDEDDDDDNEVDAEHEMDDDLVVAADSGPAQVSPASDGRVHLAPVSRRAVVGRQSARAASALQSPPSSGQVISSQLSANDGVHDNQPIHGSGQLPDAQPGMAALLGSVAQGFAGAGPTPNATQATQASSQELPATQYDNDFPQEHEPVAAGPVVEVNQHAGDVPIDPSLFSSDAPQLSSSQTAIGAVTAEQPAQSPVADAARAVEPVETLAAAPPALANSGLPDFSTEGSFADWLAQLPEDDEADDREEVPPITGGNNSFNQDWAVAGPSGLHWGYGGYQYPEPEGQGDDLAHSKPENPDDTPAGDGMWGFGPDFFDNFQG